MIGKVSTGKYASRLLAYVEHKEGAYQIDSNMAGSDRLQLAAELSASFAVRPTLEQRVWHTTLSTVPEENLSDSTWRAISRCYLQEMGFGDRQYAVYRHADTRHHHVHIIASRIDIVTGEAISDSWNWRKTEETIRDIERRFGLRQVRSSTARELTAPTTGEIRQQRRTGKLPVRIQLQTAILAAREVATDENDFIERISAQGISVALHKEGSIIRGVSFALGDIAFQGNQLGRILSWPHLCPSLARDRHQSLTQVKRKLRFAYERVREEALERLGRAPNDVYIAAKLLLAGHRVEEVEAILSQGDAVRALKEDGRNPLSSYATRDHIKASLTAAQTIAPVIDCDYDS